MTPPTKMPKLTKHVDISSSINSVIVKPATTFLDLPQEVLDMIATLLKDEQLPALRLTSKQACYSFSHIFAKVHFAHLHHHLTGSSLYDLFQITKHAMFSKYVKSVEFSTARPEFPIPRPPSESSNILEQEASGFPCYGSNTDKLVAAIENLKHHGNRKVSLGVFDSLCRRKNDLVRAIGDSPTWHSTLGHGYVKSYGAETVLVGAAPYRTMSVISRAAKISGYSLEHLSITTTNRSLTKTKLITRDLTRLLKTKANQFKSELTFKYVVVKMVKTKKHHDIQRNCLTVEVQTDASSHLLLQGRPCRLDRRISRTRIERCSLSLDALPAVFTETKYRNLTLKDLQLDCDGLRWLDQRTDQQTFECLNISNIATWMDGEHADREYSTLTFLNHFKTNYKIKKLMFMNFYVHASFGITPLRLAAEEVVAEGYDQVQSVFDDLIAQTMVWLKSIRGTSSIS